MIVRQVSRVGISIALAFAIPERVASLEQVVLEGNVVRLEPLTFEHVDQLSAVGLDDQLWGFMLMRLQTKDDMTRFV